MQFGKIKLVYGWLIFLITVFSGSFAHARILVISPHPDDDLLISAGIIYRAVHAGEPVRVVYMTNGDYGGGQDKGFTRQLQAVNAQSHLGVIEDSLYFFGYPDGFLENIYNNCLNANDACPNSWGQTTTYGKYGLGHTDYHSYRFGAPADYNSYNILSDLEDIISTYKPDHIFTLVEFDGHPDHRTTYQFVKLAVLAVHGHDPTYTPTIHKSVVWWDDPYHLTWPNPMDPTQYFSEIPDLSAITGYRWTDRESIDVPLEMQSTDYTRNPKALAIAEHVTEGGTQGFLGGFIHKDEFFWTENPGGGLPNPNIAPLATVTASSESPQYGQVAAKAVDGVIDGYPGDYTKEWATNHQGAGAWIQLSWPVPYTVDRVVLYDRPNSTDQILKATLTFSDGSALQAGPLANNGGATEYTFPVKVITSLRMTVDQVSSGTLNIGLAEIQVFGSQVAGTQYTLTVDVIPSGGGSISKNPDKPAYSNGEQVSLTATAGAGYTFSNWTGDAGGSTQNPIIVTMNGNKTATANFIASAGILSITPADGFSASGAPGGPFSPSGKTYTLQNTGNAAISWSASVTQSWLGLSSMGGNLPAGASATVTVSLNSGANSLGAGSYSDTVTFTNATNGNGNTTRIVTVSVQSASSMNIAPLAGITASSETPQYGQLAVKAVDGVIDGYPGDYTKEWATNHQGAGAWLQLNWPAAYTVDRIILYDRPNSVDQILKATLTFSDGSALQAGPLANNGGATEYTFPAKKVITSLRMTVDQVSSGTLNTGLAEIEVYGTAR